MNTREERAAKLNAALMALPIDNPERNRLRDIVRGSATQLTNRCRKYLTLGAVYAERETFRKRLNVIPTYETWCRSVGMSERDARAESARARREWADLNAKGES